MPTVSPRSRKHVGVSERDRERETMNITISEVCSKAGVAEKCKIEIRLDIPFIPEPTVDSKRSEKNEDDLFHVMYRYRSSFRDPKKNIYVIQPR